MTNNTETNTETLLSLAVAASDRENQLANELEFAAAVSLDLWDAVADDFDTEEVPCPECGVMQEFTDGHREFVRKHHFVSMCSDCA